MPDLTRISLVIENLGYKRIGHLRKKVIDIDDLLWALRACSDFSSEDSNPRCSEATELNPQAIYQLLDLIPAFPTFNLRFVRHNIDFLENWYRYKA
jgi:hypothetical protein